MGLGIVDDDAERMIGSGAMHGVDNVGDEHVGNDGTLGGPPASKG